MSSDKYALRVKPAERRSQKATSDGPSAEAQPAPDKSASRLESAPLGRQDAEGPNPQSWIRHHDRYPD